MNSPTIGLRVAGILFGLLALGHLLRLATGAEVIIAGHALPVWSSVIGVIVAGGLSLWMWKLASASKK